ncbi:TIGR03086 family protein [Kitasatospora sp. NPDC006697]|uniref:TIGR03086 family protein n=1 Tax=Kitasatospora sp. NPDC006697 TaxID=3364020 RepID=UPI003692F54A
MTRSTDGGLRELYDEAVASFGRRVAGVAANQWAAPAHGGTVRELVAGLAGAQARAAALLGGAAVAPSGDPAADWAAAAAAARSALAAPGALAREVPMDGAAVTAAEYAARLTVCLTVAIWDLAHATGQDDHLAPELVGFALRRVAPEDQPVPADPQRRLLDLLGRPAIRRAAVDPEVTG